MISYFGASVIGLVRSNNQDAYHIPLKNDGLYLFVVADGMGGQNAGEVASSLAISALYNQIKTYRLQPEASDEDISVAMRNAFFDANTLVYEAGNADKRFKNMGTTMTAAMVADNILYIAHVGDSRAYLITDGKIKQLTVDHSYVQELIDEGLLSPDEAQFHPDRNKITRALGSEKHVNVDFYMYSWQKNDVLLLCSDGLTNMLNNDQIFHIIYDHKTCREAVDKLIHAAEEAGGRDNITAICIKNEEE